MPSPAAVQVANRAPPTSDGSDTTANSTASPAGDASDVAGVGRDSDEDAVGSGEDAVGSGEDAVGSGEVCGPRLHAASNTTAASANREARGVTPDSSPLVPGNPLQNGTALCSRLSRQLRLHRAAPTCLRIPVIVMPKRSARSLIGAGDSRAAEARRAESNRRAPRTRHRDPPPPPDRRAGLVPYAR